MHGFDFRTPPACPTRRMQTNSHWTNSETQIYPNKTFCLTWNQLWRPNAPQCASRSYSAVREGGDLEVSKGIHSVSFLSLFVLSFSPQGLCFTWTRQQRHATLNLRSFPRRLLALSPPESANDRCYLYDSNLLQSEETYLPNQWCQNCRFGQVDLCSQPGVRWSLLSPSKSLQSQTFLFP